MQSHQSKGSHIPTTWVVVANGKEAQVYVREYVAHTVPLAGGAKHQYFNEVHQHELAALPDAVFHAEPAETYEIDQHQRGRSQESASAARHASEPHEDVRDKIKHHLAKSVASYIKKASSAKAFDSLVLVAPVSMLKEIKSQLGSELCQKIVAEVPKDLVRFSKEDIIGHLKEAGD